MPNPQQNTPPRRVLHTFLDVVALQRFSLCFTAGADGVLGLDEAPPARLLKSAAAEHWALQLRGSRVGNRSLTAQAIHGNPMKIQWKLNGNGLLSRITWPSPTRAPH